MPKYQARNSGTLNFHSVTIETSSALPPNRVGSVIWTRAVRYSSNVEDMVVALKLVFSRVGCDRDRQSG